MLEHKIRPHYYCLPILKREEDRKALVNVALSGNEIFLGTDSAPHSLSAKETECGCAGIFNTINSIEMLAQLFDDNGRIENLIKFTSFNGAKHYEVKINNEKIELIKKNTK